jgi:carboxyl-terminal processing protease
MRIIVIALSIAIFATSLFGFDAKEKYNKVILNIENYYYKPYTKKQIVDKSIEELLKTTPLLNKNEHKDIKTIIDFLVKNKYSQEKIYDMLIHASIDSLDAHSCYLDKQHMQELKIQTEGVFSGLGISVSKKNKNLIVISPLDDSPAFYAGVKTGDIILKINKQLTKNMSLSKAVSLLRGKVQTTVDLEILRKNEIISMRLVRDFIKIKSVYSKQLDGGILYLRISSFDKKSLKSVSDEIKKNISSNHGIILDLRNNPGGLLDQAIGVSDIFINRGTIIAQKGRDSEEQKVYNASKINTLTQLPLVILINAGSASASEIVSGALQMHHRATIFGENSFGKGSVQAIFNITKQEAIKLTVAQYLLADGNSIDNIGIKPDYQVEADIVDGKDMALKAAKDYLSHQNIFNRKLNFR